MRTTRAARAAGKLSISTLVNAVVGRTYLLRSANPDAQDALVAFTIVAIDRLGMTIAWRTLAAWPMAEKK